MPPAMHSENPTLKLPTISPTGASSHGTSDPADVEVGAPVEVRSSFDHHWSRGFSVAEVNGDACRLRRASDGTTLPAWFPVSEIRPVVNH